MSFIMISSRFKEGFECSEIFVPLDDYDTLNRLDGGQNVTICTQMERVAFSCSFQTSIYLSIIENNEMDSVVPLYHRSIYDQLSCNFFVTILGRCT